MNKREDELRIQFLKTFANLPMGVRKEIILVFNKEPVTWSVVYLEVNQRTKMGDEMLQRLKELKFI